MFLSVTLGALSALLAALYLATRARTRSLRFQLDALRTERDARSSLSDELLSTVAHELRTPLTSIRGALGLLAGTLDTPDLKTEKLLRIALANTERLTRLINDILDLERMESGRAPLQLRRCDLAGLVRDAADTMSAQAEAAGVSLCIEPALSLLAFPLQADSDRLLQVLTNLLSNAIKFSPAGAAIRIGALATSTSLLLTVADEGRGVPAAQLEAIFERFHQVEPADARQKGGSGLGLAICRTIVQQHGGSITAEPNHPRPGVTFRIHLPLPPDAALPEDLTVAVA